MPIPPDLWRYNVRGVLERIGDENYQRRTWFVPDPDFASPTEWYLELFNDNFFDEFIESGDVGLSTELRTACKGFSRLFKEYFDGLPDHPDPAAIIDDPGWRRIRDEARVLLDGLP